MLHPHCCPVLPIIVFLLVYQKIYNIFWGIAYLLIFEGTAAYLLFTYALVLQWLFLLHREFADATKRFADSLLLLIVVGAQGFWELEHLPIPGATGPLSWYQFLGPVIAA